MIDESHLPFEQQSLVFRLRKRAEIRLQNDERKSVVEGRPDRVASLLHEAAARIDRLEAALKTIAEKSAYAAKFAAEAGEMMFADHARGARKCALDALGSNPREAASE